MDTKSNDAENRKRDRYYSEFFSQDGRKRKLHPVKSSIAFFLAVNMIFIAIFAGLMIAVEVLPYQSWNKIEDYARSAIPTVKLYDSAKYRELMVDYITALNYYLNSEEISEYQEEILYWLENEVISGNIIVYAKNNTTGKEYSRNSQIDEFHRDGLLYNDGNFYYVHPLSHSVKSNSITLIPMKRNYDTDKTETETENIVISDIDVNAPVTETYDYTITLFNRDLLSSSVSNAFSNPDCTIYVLAINSDMMEGYASQLYSLYQDLNIIHIAFISCIAYLIVMILLSVYASAKRRDRIYANYCVAGFLNNFWIELKLAAYALLIIIPLAVIFDGMWIDDVYWLIIGCVMTFWVLYIVGVDVRHNGFRRCFGNNIFMSLKRHTEKMIDKLIFHYNSNLQERPFVKAMKKKFIHYVLIMTAILFFFMLSLIVFATSGGDFGAFLFMMIFIGLGIYFTVKYVRKTSETLYEFTKISDKIMSIRNGIESDPLIFPPESLLKNTAYALNDVQNGVKRAVEEQMKSERMKIELVTNVSHDIKTPLTSLISYTELLAQCEDLPDEAKDYVKILKDKLRRLTELIGNLFDLSKATTNEMEVVREEIDLRKLINQVDAQFEDVIAETGLKFIYRMPDEPVILISDGAKLHRVFENLYINCLKYSLEGSRVYVSLIPSHNNIRFSIANISREEIDYTAEEIMARFVRGDKTRSTDGSGLGLAIARSFIELCGGSFSLDLDGDVFKVTIIFPSYNPVNPVTNQLMLDN